VFGIEIGPQVLGLAQPDQFIEFFQRLGLGCSSSSPGTRSTSSASGGAHFGWPAWLLERTLFHTGAPNSLPN
jgi:hypothetical protein